MADEEDEGAGDAPKTVPYERFQRVNAERRQFKEQVEALKALEGAASELPKLQAELARRDGLLELARAGILDDDGAEVAMMLHGRLPEKDRPTIGDWIAALRGTPDAIPKPLQAYLVAPAETTKAAAGPAPARSAAPATSQAGAVTQQMVQAAYSEAARATAGAERDRLVTVARELAARSKR